MMTPDIEKLIASLREMCVDFDGSQIVDGASPRYEPDCGILRQAADTLASLVREREALRPDPAAIEAAVRKVNPGRSEDHIKSVALDCLSVIRSLSSERREGP